MNGFENISANNGWAISIIGITIVFTGLIFLATVITIFPKIMDLWENRGQLIKNLRQKFDSAPACQTTEPLKDITLTHDVRAAISAFKLLVERLPQPFPLPKLIEIAESCGQTRPHAIINDFLLIGLIQPDGKGFYNWNLQVEQQLAAAPAKE